MAAHDPVRHITPANRTEGDATAGMVREQAIAVDGLWAGFVRTEPGSATGWHHHGEYETSIYIISGEFRIEFGPGGRDALDAKAGDFLHVPAGAIHREITPGDAWTELIVVRGGHGQATFNVDGPASA